MKSFSRKRVLSPSLFFLAVGALIHCGGDDHPTSFTAQGDSAVMSGIVGTWMGTSNSGSTYTLTLCEDTSAAVGAISDLSCQTLHTVKGDGRGKTETVTEPEGCGGCDYDNSAYVTGTVEGDDLISSKVHGQFALTGGDTTALGFPYQIEIGHVGAADNFVALTGTMSSVGAFDVGDFDYTPVAAAAIDASAEDAGDAGEIDANDGDSGAVPPPAPSATSPSGSSQVDLTSGITFHRVGDAVCP